MAQHVKVAAHPGVGGVTGFGQPGEAAALPQPRISATALMAASASARLAAAVYARLAACRMSIRPPFDGRPHARKTRRNGTQARFTVLASAARVQDSPPPPPLPLDPGSFFPWPSACQPANVLTRYYTETL